IFERFFQVDKTLKKNKEGTGIGLHLVKSFVEMHNGTVTIKSELGKGTEFIIKLPAVVCEKQVKSKNIIYEANIERINMEFSDINQ
ncbi:TPA: ATP-binding protein, partial [Clostridium botulinum]